MTSALCRGVEAVKSPAPLYIRRLIAVLPLLLAPAALAEPYRVQQVLPYRYGTKVRVKTPRGAERLVSFHRYHDDPNCAVSVQAGDVLEVVSDDGLTVELALERTGEFCRADPYATWKVVAVKPARVLRQGVNLVDVSAQQTRKGDLMVQEVLVVAGARRRTAFVTHWGSAWDASGGSYYEANCTLQRGDTLLIKPHNAGLFEAGAKTFFMTAQDDECAIAQQFSTLLR